MTVTAVTDLERCAAIWREHAGGGLPFGDWALRQGLAEMCGMTLRFLVDEATGTALPAGIHDGMMYFYGGLRYSEHNDFIGPEGGERRILAALFETKTPFRLLSWVRDPIPYVPETCLDWDVPYNQYWMFNGAASYDQHVASLPPKTAKEALYLGRKFAFVPVESDDPQTTQALIESFMDATIEAFAKRGATCVYQRPDLRAMGLLVCRLLQQRGVLRMTRIDYGEEAVGLTILADDPASRQAVYLFNLYRSSPSDISNGGTLAALRYGGDRGRAIDGMRGAFTLKPKFGFRPVPSYGLVSDPAWKRQAQTDLDPDQLKALYGRRFGARRGSARKPVTGIGMRAAVDQ